MNIKLKSGERIESFIPRQPDWQQLYYNLALRMTSAHEKLVADNPATASEIIKEAVNTIWKTEAAIEIGNDIVTVQTTPGEVA